MALSLSIELETGPGPRGTAVIAVPRAIGGDGRRCAVVADSAQPGVTGRHRGPAVFGLGATGGVERHVAAAGGDRVDVDAR